MTGHRLAAVAVIVAALLPLGLVALKGEVPSFRDHEDYFVPLRAFTAEAIRDGEMPMWNPFNGAGEPWLANPQTGVFYPPAWLVAILPFEFGYVAFLSLHLAVLGLGLRQLFRLHGSDAAATLVAVAFVVSGPMLSLLDVSNNLATFAWAPWLLARALRRDPEPGIADTVLLALCFLGGEPLLAAVTWIAWALIVLVRLGRAGLWRVAWRIFTAIALSAAQLLPFVELLVGSDRAAGLAPEIAFRNSMAVRDWLATVVTRAGVQPGWVMAIRMARRAYVVDRPCVGRAVSGRRSPARDASPHSESISGQARAVRIRRPRCARGLRLRPAGGELRPCADSVCARCDRVRDRRAVPSSVSLCADCRDRCSRRDDVARGLHRAPLVRRETGERDEGAPGVGSPAGRRILVAGGLAFSPRVCAVAVRSAVRERSGHALAPHPTRAARRDTYGRRSRTGS